MRQEVKTQSPWVILACAWLLGFAMFAPTVCVPPIMNIIKETLHLSHSQVGLIFAVPLITVAAFAIPSGALADRIGIRKAAGIGAIVMIVGSLLRGSSASFVSLLAYTFLYGAGFGLVFPNLPKLVGTWFPSEKIGMATGIYSTGVVIGCAVPLAITLPLVFPITHTFQGVLYLWSIPAIIAAIVWWILVRDSPDGSVQNKSKEQGRRPSYKIWSNRTLWMVTILFFINNVANYTWTGWTPQLMLNKGASADLAGLIASLYFWVAIPTVFIVPWASDRIGLRKPFLWTSFILLLLASISAIYTPLQLGWFIVAAAGIALAAQFSIMLILPPELVPAEGVGRASGMMLSVAYIGGLVGPWLAGYIIDLTGSLDLHLIILGGLAAVAVYLAFKLPETGPKLRRFKQAPLL